MNLKRTLAGLTAAAALVLAPMSAPAFADEPPAPTGVPAAVPLSNTPKIANWQQLQYGLFMHFGVYSLYGGNYKGHRQHMGYPEQIKAWEKIPTEEYKAMAKGLASNFDASAICKTARDAGMKYLMITSKHHDGFAMWDTKTTDYNIVKLSDYGKDPMKELSTECNKLGVKMAFYFSIIDWTKHEPEPYGNQNPITEELMTGTIKPQITELLTNYGPIQEFWFDMGGPTADQSQRMAQWVHELQPDTMVNSRVWNKAGDFEVGGDNSVTTDFHMAPWESIRSIFPSCWGYCTWADRSASRKGTKIHELVSNLVGTIASGGQFAYNIGPKGDGTIEEFDTSVVTEVGSWLKRHPDALTGARPTWFPAPDWGKVTTKANALYFIPEDWKDGKTLTLPGVGSRVTGVTVDGTGRALEYKQDGTTLTVTESGEDPEPGLRPVIKVTFDEEPTYLPTQTVTAVDGATIAANQFFGRASAMRYSGAQAYDAYLVNKGDKPITEMTLKFSGKFAAETAYKITLGTTSIEASGAQINAGEVGQGFTLEPGKVTPLRVELAHPAYYADPIGIGEPSATIHVYGEGSDTQPPVITENPASVSVTEGENAPFTVAASGRPAPTIAWYRVPKGATEGTLIEGATEASYTFKTTIDDDGAQFYAVATNSNGSTTSARATLTVTKASNNLALNKAASMSSTGWGGVASRAVDGNTDGVWDNGSLAHTGRQANPWWEVDLGQNHSLGTVNVWNRSASDDCQGTPCNQRLHDFWVIASKERLSDTFDPATAAEADGVHMIKVEGVGGRPTAVDFKGADARYIRVLQPTSLGEFALAEVEAFAAQGSDPDPEDKPVAPEIRPLAVTANPAKDAQINGDGAFRTVTAKKGTQVTIKATVSGKPDPTLSWQIKRKGSDSWETLDKEKGAELTFAVDDAYNGAVIRLTARNEAGAAESGLVAIAVASDPAPDPTPDPKPDHTVGTWMHDGIGWWWKITGGGYAKNETLTLGGSVYRFDHHGYMITGWVYWEGAWRYHNDSGAQVSGWMGQDGRWFYLRPDTGAMVTGWEKIADKWYLFASNGVMVTGWNNVNGSWYYLDPSGAMHTGWLQLGSTWYLLEDNGAMVTGWKLMGDTWYYFDASGAMATGWLQIGNHWYYFGEGGDMYTGRHQIGGRWYNFASSGEWLG